MRAVTVLLAIGFAAVVAIPTKQALLVGGSGATVSQYPSVVALLYATSCCKFNQACVGSVVTTRAILTAAHCVFGDAVSKWRAQTGSSCANSGGAVYSLANITVHPSFSIRTFDYDIAILRTVASIGLSNNVKPVIIAGDKYKLPDNQILWAVGWGTTTAGAAPTEQLRHIQAWSINQTACASRYAVFGANVTANMLCFGWPNIGSRDLCQGDSGVPIYHNSVLVGIGSWGYGCANAAYPGVNTRVSSVAKWIQSNA